MAKRPANSERYLELLKKSLLDELYLENEARLNLLFSALLGIRSFPGLDALIDAYVAIRNDPFFALLRESRETGAWLAMKRAGETLPPPEARNVAFVAHSMIGRARMDNLHACLNAIIADDIPGDLIETGVWRGGATIFMRGFLAAHKIPRRKVWVADSFAGMPKPSNPRDASCDLSGFPYLAVSQEEVEELFARYDLLDKRVKFLQGWFKDTLPTAPIKKLALLRLDGDLYESTMDGLRHLYHKVSPGGFVIVDDYYAVSSCQTAVDDFRLEHGIKAPLVGIDHDSVYWRKPAK